MKKINLLLINSCLMTFPVLSVISCSQNNINLNKEGLLKTNLEWNYEYIRAFRDEEYDDTTLNHDVWIKDEKIYEDDKFKIYVEGQRQNNLYLDLFSKKIMKWYLIDVSINNFLIDKKSKNEIQNTICKRIIDEFDSMVMSKFTSNNIYIPLTSENYSTKMNNDDYGSFKSSWGVWNGTTKEVNFDFNINERLIRNQLLSEKNINDKAVVINNVKLNDLYYLPLIEIINPPVGNAYWTQRAITFNGDNIVSDQNNQKNKIRLPKGADKGQEWWRWFTDGGKVLWDSISLGLSVAGTLLPGASAIGQVMSWASIIMGSVSIGDSIRSTIMSTLKKEYDKNSDIINDFSKTLIDNGYQISLNQYLNLNSNNIINIWANIEYRAKATAAFGDRTEARIYDAAGLLTTSIEWSEYVKK